MHPQAPIDLMSLADLEGSMLLQIQSLRAMYRNLDDVVVDTMLSEKRAALVGELMIRESNLHKTVARIMELKGLA